MAKLNKIPEGQSISFLWITGSAKSITKDQVDPTSCLLYQFHRFHWCELSYHCAYNTKGVLFNLNASQSSLVDIFH